jgi:osmotically-inducible protein OsmY
MAVNRSAQALSSKLECTQQRAGRLRPGWQPIHHHSERRMKTDAQLKADVTQELSWDPAINATAVGVAVKDGVVTLTGHLQTYAEKFALERALQRVQGVHAIALELDVKLSPSHQRSDTDIANAAETALQWHALVPAERLRVKVEKGWVTLSGELDWDYQRSAAEKAVRPLTGVIGVSNTITLKPQATPVNVKQRIQEALTRQAEREAKHMEVQVSGSSVTLQGKVHSWAERAAAQGAAWAAPGVTLVVNNLQVER